MGSDRKEKEMICALTAEEHRALQRGLGELPDTMPPRAVWHRIRAQAEAEGLIEKPRLQRRTTWYAGAGLAAAAVLAVVMLPGVIDSPTQFPTVPESTPSNSVTQVSVLQALMVESRQLESELRSLPDEPRVMRAGTVATISDLEERIAAIDYQLNDPEVLMTSEDRELFWRERVRLMKLLLQLRYAQAQRAAF